jgi:hypothetical protein
VRVLSVDPGPFDVLPALNAAGAGRIERIELPLLRGRVDRLPAGVDALVAAADLQALEEPTGEGPMRLVGEALAERLVDLAGRGELPPPRRTGVLLAGDLYTVPDLARRGGLGDVRRVWRAFAARFRFAAGVLGNHDALGDGPRDAARFARDGGAHLLDGEVRDLSGLRVGGVAGIIGAPSRPNRQDPSTFVDKVEAVLADEPDVLVLHEGPAARGPDGAGLKGSHDVRSVLEGAGLPAPPLVVCGHTWWPVPLVELAGGVQVLKVDARVVVLERS